MSIKVLTAGNEKYQEKQMPNVIPFQMNVDYRTLFVGCFHLRSAMF